MEKLKCAEDVASHFVDQTIDAVQYLHKLKIAHRDIKPENIVIQFGVLFYLFRPLSSYAISVGLPTTKTK